MAPRRTLIKIFSLALVGGGVLALAFAARPAALDRLGPAGYTVYWAAHAAMVVLAGHRFVRPRPLGALASLSLGLTVAASVWTESRLREGEDPVSFFARLAFFALCYFALRLAGRLSGPSEDA